MFPGFRTAICRSAVLVGMLTDSSDTFLLILSGFLGHVIPAPESNTGSCGTTNRVCVLKRNSSILLNFKVVACKVQEHEGRRTLWGGGKNTRKFSGRGGKIVKKLTWSSTREQSASSSFFSANIIPEWSVSFMLGFIEYTAGTISLKLIKIWIRPHAGDVSRAQ